MPKKKRGGWYLLVQKNSSINGTLSVDRATTDIMLELKRNTARKINYILCKIVLEKYTRAAQWEIERCITFGQVM